MKQIVKWFFCFTLVCLSVNVFYAAHQAAPAAAVSNKFVNKSGEYMVLGLESGQKTERIAPGKEIELSTLTPMKRSNSVVITVDLTGAGHSLNDPYYQIGQFKFEPGEKTTWTLKPDYSLERNSI